MAAPDQFQLESLDAQVLLDESDLMAEMKIQ
jgi:hypothetical protein